MAAMNAWLSFPSNTESFNHELAIRRFCPARIEQEQGGGEWEDGMNEIDQPWSPYNAVSPPCLAALRKMNSSIASLIWMATTTTAMMITRPSKANKGLIIIFKGMKPLKCLRWWMRAMKMQGWWLRGGSWRWHRPDAKHGRGEPWVDQGLQLVHSLLACAEAVGLPGHPACRLHAQPDMEVC
ncbi:hypothetical protein CK203_104929 [Vitis vinifera]|uniref:Uncharacterized protein n=1 Tax=Vitis vinifera TaxID=29760 RepID=A0A438CQZ2_VITVI|nr:hypothetical protein CK203_104929 [Vitis vinifera]